MIEYTCRRSDAFKRVTAPFPAVMGPGSGSGTGSGTGSGNGSGNGPGPGTGPGRDEKPKPPKKEPSLTKKLSSKVTALSGKLTECKCIVTEIDGSALLLVRNGHDLAVMV